MLESTLVDVTVICSTVANIAGVVLLYLNRKALLYEEGNLSLGRVWGWIGFYIAVVYWVKYLLGVIPSTTPFPPFLEDFIYASLIYNFAKHGNRTAERMLDLWSSRKFEYGDRPWKLKDINPAKAEDFVPKRIREVNDE